MRLGIITLFPEIINGLKFGITGRAIEKRLIEIQCWNPRDFTEDSYKTVDDRPYGGGPGMVMKVEPLAKAVTAAKAALPNAKVIYLSPQGQLYKAQNAIEMAKRKEMIFVAGRYEGIDERFIEKYVDEEWSIGDYVLSGGELPAMVMIDSITRLLPGALGDENSAAEDSFMDQGLLDYPHYTRPEEYEGMKVPEVLLGGNHAEIKRWRQNEALKRTKTRRPELVIGEKR